jgi:hypothetical protein
LQEDENEAKKDCPLALQEEENEGKKGNEQGSDRTSWVVTGSVRSSTCPARIAPVAVTAISAPAWWREDGRERVKWCLKGAMKRRGEHCE